MFGKVGLGFIVVTMAFMFVASPAWAQDLSITKRDAPDPVDVGELLRYTLVVQNEGPLAATGGFTVRDEVPKGVEVVGVTTSDPANCTVNDREVQCVFIDTLAAPNTTDDSDSATVVITVNPREAGDKVNEATVAATTVGSDGVSGNNTSEVTTDVRAAQRQKNNNPKNRNNPPIIVIDDDGNLDDPDDDPNEEDDDETGDIDSEATISEFSDTGGEDTTGEFNDNDEDTPGAVADSSTGEASTPGAVANAGGDPDEQAPVSQEQVEEQGGEVVDEVETTGPLPETGGASLVYLLPLAGCVLLALTLVRRGRD